MTCMVSADCFILWRLWLEQAGVGPLVARTNPAYTSTACLACFQALANQRSARMHGVLDEGSACATQGRQAWQQRPSTESRSTLACRRTAREERFSVRYVDGHQNWAPARQIPLVRCDSNSSSSSSTSICRQVQHSVSYTQIQRQATADGSEVVIEGSEPCTNGSRCPCPCQGSNLLFCSSCRLRTATLTCA
jgi:hypothetical protein